MRDEGFKFHVTSILAGQLRLRHREAGAWLGTKYHSVGELHRYILAYNNYRRRPLQAQHR